ncbi:MAG TPA: DUF447 domain-containing protein [Pirellulales bacterium]|jgi:hypothetical protein|nr:DUF447 domain-containing protein [Pirellulales bacterium]
MPFILEGLVSSTNADGSPHLAPMGPEAGAAMDRLVLKPFPTSTTYQNLRRTGVGVFHVTDDVEQLARSAMGDLQPAPRWLDAHPAEGGWILAGACRWYAFRVGSIDDSAERVRMEAEVVEQGRLRDFCGFNRAQHAVLEAAILATRVERLPADEIFAQLERLRPLVEKTGGAAEERAWAYLDLFFRARLGR